MIQYYIINYKVERATSGAMYNLRGINNMYEGGTRSDFVVTGSRKGTMGSALTGSTANVVCFLAQMLVGTPVKSIFPKYQTYISYLESGRIHIAFAAAPLVSTPFVRSQGNPEYQLGRSLVYIYIYM